MPRRIVNTEMTGDVPSTHGPRGGEVIEQSGCLPIRILDASTALATVPKRTMTMRVNAAPRADLGLSRTRRNSTTKY